MVADRETGDLGADLANDAAALVPHHQGYRQDPVPLADVQIGMAHAGRDDIDEHLGRTGCRQVDVHHLDRQVRIGEDHRTHDWSIL